MIPVLTPLSTHQQIHPAVAESLLSQSVPVVLCGVPTVPITGGDNPFRDKSLSVIKSRQAINVIVKNLSCKYALLNDSDTEHLCSTNIEEAMAQMESDPMLGALGLCKYSDQAKSLYHICLSSVMVRVTALKSIEFRIPDCESFTQDIRALEYQCRYIDDKIRVRTWCASAV